MDDPTFWQLHGAQTKYSDFAAASSAAVAYSVKYSTEIMPTYASHLRVSELVEQYTVSHDPCFPTVTVPSSRFTLTNKENGQLTYCGGAFGFYDPPFALTRGTGFSTEATTTSAAAEVNSKVAAATPTVQPGSSPVPTTAALTGLSPAATESIMALSPGTKGISAANDPATLPAKVNPPATSNSPTTSSTSTPVAANNPPATPVANNPAVTSNAPAPTTSPNPIILTPVTQATPTTNAPAQVTVDSSTIVADPSSAFVIASQTLTAGGQVTHANSVYSLATNGRNLVVTGSSTQVLADPATPATTPAKITVGGSTITANPSSAFVIASQTLTPGGKITHSDIVYSLASNGANLVVAASSTQNIAFPSPAPSAPAAYVIGSQTLVPGAAALISGTVVSLQAGGSSVVVAGTTAPLSQYLAMPTSVIVGGQTQALSAFLADATGAASLVSGGTTQALSLVQGASSGAPPSVVVGGSKTVALTQFLASATGEASVAVGSKTHPLSSYLAAVTGGATVVVGSETKTLTSLLAQATGSSGVAGIIASFGGFATPSPKTTSYVQVGANGTYNGTMYVGSGAALERSILGAGCMALLGILGTLML